jgi:hypothetical protein
MFILSFIDTAIVLSMCILSFIFVIVCGLFEWQQICTGFYICFPVVNPVIKRGWLATKNTIICHLNSLNTEREKTTYDVGNQGPGLEQTQQCGGIKPVNGIPTILS